MRKFTTVWRLKIAGIAFLGSAFGSLTGNLLGVALVRILWGGTP